MKKPSPQKAREEDVQRAVTLAYCRKPRRKFWAWLLAGHWREYVKAKGQNAAITRQVISDLKFHLPMTGLVGMVVDCVRSGNADKLHAFADYLTGNKLDAGPNIPERYRPHDKIRLWLALKHTPNKKGILPSYTHDDLLDDAAAHGLKMDERQLRRLMDEAGFSFKHSRSQ